jgi:serine/threonine protein phosphatase 1
MKYVMGDIHGEFDKFTRMLKLINFNNDDRLYVIGDCIDRGEDGIKVLQYIIKHPYIELLWGNHEKLMMDFLESCSEDHKLLWFINGGVSTYDSFNLLSEDERSELHAFVKNLPYYKIVDKYILCHAGIRVMNNASSMKAEDILKSQSVKDFLWIREDFYKMKAIDGYTVIFGHTPSVYIDEDSIDDNGEFCAWHDKKYKDKICIDCCAPQPYGRLCCIRLDDLQEFYI